MKTRRVTEVKKVEVLYIAVNPKAVWGIRAFIKDRHEEVVLLLSSIDADSLLSAPVDSVDSSSSCPS